MSKNSLSKTKAKQKKRALRKAQSLQNSSLESFQSPFPLNDFYAEIQTDTGSKLRMRWVPFEAPVSSADCLLLCRECYYATFKDEAVKRNANATVRAEVNRISGLTRFKQTTLMQLSIWSIKAFILSGISF